MTSQQNRFAPHSSLNILLWIVISAAITSFSMTVYGIWFSRTYLPSGEILGYAHDLVRVAEGRPRWEWLWERHNQVHLVVLPKLVYWLDILLIDGRGWVTTMVAFIVQCITMGIWLFFIWQSSFPAIKKYLLVALSVLMLTSMIQAECFIVEPINIQWLFLALGITLTSHGLTQGCRYPVLVSAAGMMISLLSGGPFWLVLIAWGFVWWRMNGKGAQKFWQNFLRYLPALLMVLAFEEFVRVFFFDGQRPVVVLLYLWGLPASQGDAVRNVLDAAPSVDVGAYLQWGIAISKLVSMVLTPPVNVMVPTIVSGMAAIFLLGVFIKNSFGKNPDAFLLHIATFVFLLALAIGLFRAFPDPENAYTWRFAGLGLMFVLGAIILLLKQDLSGWRGLLLNTLLLTLVGALLWGGYQELHRALLASRIARQSQVAYAVGSTDVQSIAQHPGYFWQYDQAAKVLAARESLKASGIGIYASLDYRMLQGISALPSRQVQCTLSITMMKAHPEDPDARRISGLAMDDHGRAIRHVLVFSGSGDPLGFAVPDPFLSNSIVPWQLSAGWAGHWRAEGPLAAIKLIAWDGNQRCQDLTLAGGF